MMKRIAVLFFFVVTMQAAQDVFAQATAVQKYGTGYRTALDQYAFENYATAGNIFAFSDEQSVNSLFFQAISELALENTNAENRLMFLIKKYPTSEMIPFASFKLGSYFFFRNHYADALVWFNKAQDGTDHALSFEKGYAHLQNNDTLAAQRYLNDASREKGPFQEDAVYYSAQVYYQQNKLDSSLSELKTLEDSKKYAGMATLVICQIYLSRGNYNEVIKRAEALLKRDGKYSPLLYKLLGNAYFFKGNYTRARQNFERFKSDQANFHENDEDRYQIGYSEYIGKNYEAAAAELEKLVDSQNIFAQSGMFTLGLTDVKLNRKEPARNAFKRSIEINAGDKNIESAYVSFIKLSYEQGIDADALNAARQFIASYPRSPSLNEVKGLLAQLLLNAKDYEGAYTMASTLPRYKENEGVIFQKIAFYSGLRKFSASEFSAAVNRFDQSIKVGISPSLVKLALFWKAEALYELNDFKSSAETYVLFLGEKGPIDRDIRVRAFYGQGYSFFEDGQYAPALRAFQRFLHEETGQASVRNDATLREADCHFMLRNYALADAAYQKIAKSNSKEVDYAQYQQAMVEGLQNRTQEKLTSLKQLIADHPSSAYAANALFEMGNTYAAMGSFDAAQTQFDLLVERFPQSTYTARAQLALGLMAYNQNRDEEALSRYKMVLEKFPNSEASKSALSAAKKIFIDKGKAQAFLDFTRGTQDSNLAETAKDSLTYQAAYALYAKGSLLESKSAFESYFQNFPKGVFITASHHYHAACLGRLNKVADALPDYLFVYSNSTDPVFLTNAAAGAATDYLLNGDCDHALPFLRVVEKNETDQGNYHFALVNLMQCHWKNNDADSTSFYASKILSSITSSPAQKNEANLLSGKSLLIKKDTASAMKFLLPVSATTANIFSAEARFLVASIDFDRGHYQRSQKVLFDAIKQLSEFDYWVARSYILLADNYARIGNVFQAKSTLKSILANYKGNDDVKFIAQNKLDNLTRQRQ